jgi:hypothetical protein
MSEIQGAPPELLARTFAVDVRCCPTCGGRMKLLAMVTDPKSVARVERADQFDS